MKLLLSPLALALIAPVHVAGSASEQVSTTFFVPMDETELLHNGFEWINSDANGNTINTMISITASIDGTIIYYDHHEDGYDGDVTSGAARSTEVWGDRNKTNGCAPLSGERDYRCSDSDDYIPAGTAIVVTNDVPVDRDRGTTILYDGGDRVQSNYPVAMTRAAFPLGPGSLMAGAVEVRDTNEWGKRYVVPASNVTQLTLKTFDYVAVFAQAAEDDTVVTYNNVDYTIGMGESFIKPMVVMNEVITSNKPVQVSFLTGDRTSSYEMRWFSLTPAEDLAKDYLAPVGDSKGETKVYLHNHNNYEITVTCYYYKRYYQYFYRSSSSYSIPAGGWSFTDFIVSGSAMRCKNIHNDGKFNALSITDTQESYRQGNYVYTTRGQAFDWGHPVVPFDKLSDQVLIGLGFGCTDNECIDTIHSAVWVAPAEDAYVYVDYDNDGTVEAGDTYYVPYLQSIVVKDTDDADMSGALIYAKNSDGQPVKIAAAWGQHPESVDLSSQDQQKSLDLGTVVLPFPVISASKSVELLNDNDGNGIISHGDDLKYTIRLSNIGQVHLPRNTFTIVDDGLDGQLIYEAGSTLFYNQAETDSKSIPDSGTTNFPLDEGGIINEYWMRMRGGFSTITFNVRIKPRQQCNRDYILNSGYAEYNGATHPFSVKVELPPAPDTELPTAGPIDPPTTKPSAAPFPQPTSKPSPMPTDEPTSRPTKKPTLAPTTFPPSSAPTFAPTTKPRYAPPSPYGQGGCPVPIGREALTKSTFKRELTHDHQHPTYVLPERFKAGMNVD